MADSFKLCKKQHSVFYNICFKRCQGKTRSGHFNFALTEIILKGQAQGTARTIFAYKWLPDCEVGEGLNQHTLRRERAGQLFLDLRALKATETGNYL